MNLSEKICIMLSKLCSKLPIPRPEVLKTTEGYCEEEFRLAKEFETTFRTRIKFENKRVLDLGCGLGGQTVYFALQQPEIAVGVDIYKDYLPPAVDYAKKKQITEKVDFIRGDATHLPFKENTFEMIVMYHVIEHVPQVSKTFQECKKILKHGGLLYVAFPSWLYPYGAHLWGHIPIPWCHLIFSEKTLVNITRKLLSFTEPKRCSHTIEQFQNLSKITIRRFKEIVKKTDLETMFYEDRFRPGVMSILRFLPLFIREFFVSNAVCILRKRAY